MSNARASTLWIMLLTLASTATTLALACATPFPALAALAAVHMRRTDGVFLMLAAWVASQAVGFCMMGYPTDPATIGWALAIGSAAIGAALAASGLATALAARPLAVRLIAAYLAGFVAFKAVILLWSLGLGSVGPALSLEIMARQFVRNAAILAGLYTLYRVLVAAGVPAAAPVAARG